MGNETITVIFIAILAFVFVCWVFNVRYNHQLSRLKEGIPPKRYWYVIKFNAKRGSLYTKEIAIFNNKSVWPTGKPGIEQERRAGTEIAKQRGLGAENVEVIEAVPFTSYTPYSLKQGYDYREAKTDDRFFSK